MSAAGPSGQQAQQLSQHAAAAATAAAAAASASAAGPSNQQLMAMLVQAQQQQVHIINAIIANMVMAPFDPGQVGQAPPVQQPCAAIGAAGGSIDASRSAKQSNGRRASFKKRISLRARDAVCCAKRWRFQQRCHDQQSACHCAVARFRPRCTLTALRVLWQAAGRSGCRQAAALRGMQGRSLLQR